MKFRQTDPVTEILSFCSLTICDRVSSRQGMVVTQICLFMLGSAADHVSVCTNFILLLTIACRYFILYLAIVSCDLVSVCILDYVYCLIYCGTCFQVHIDIILQILWFVLDAVPLWTTQLHIYLSNSPKKVQIIVKNYHKYYEQQI